MKFVVHNTGEKKIARVSDQRNPANIIKTSTYLKVNDTPYPPCRVSSRCFTVNNGGQDTMNDAARAMMARPDF
jgi:hypothetical protein